MADGHYGYQMPIGGVAAYRNKVSVSGVGFDISCGNLAIKTEINTNNHGDFPVYSSEFLNSTADDINEEISFGMGRKNKSLDAPINHDLFIDDAWNIIPSAFRDKLKDTARAQLGTVGGGNHYVDIFSDEQGYIWIGVHFGSRGLGHHIATAFLALSQNLPWDSKNIPPETEGLLSLNSYMGKDYWDLMQLAGRYAYAGREWVARKVAETIGATKELDLVHNNHNFAWKEKHDLGNGEEEVIVVRKGATPAYPGLKGFVGGSMGDNAVILEGSMSSYSYLDPDGTYVTMKDSMFSTVHGAGRVMSRTAATGKSKWGKIKGPGLVSKEKTDKWLHDKGIVLRGGGLDESPYAYRRLSDVLLAQGDTIKVLAYLSPIIVTMADDSVVDKYKD